MFGWRRKRKAAGPRSARSDPDEWLGLSVVVLEEGEAERLAAELAEVRAEKDWLTLRLAHGDEVMAALKRSPSWRLTRPLRAAKALLRR